MIQDNSRNTAMFNSIERCVWGNKGNIAAITSALRNTRLDAMRSAYEYAYSKKSPTNRDAFIAHFVEVIYTNVVQYALERKRIESVQAAYSDLAGVI